MISIRNAKTGDGAALYSMVRALAVSHGLERQLMATPDDLEAALFGRDPVVGALLAEVDAEPAGCAIWHRSFSTFRGREVMYLEDLSVLPQFRRRGVARALLKAVARLARDKGYPSIYWLMMDWNEEGRALYMSAGAEIEGQTSFCRLHGEALERLAQ